MHWQALALMVLLVSLSPTAHATKKAGTKKATKAPVAPSSRPTLFRDGTHLTQCRVPDESDELSFEYERRLKELLGLDEAFSQVKLRLLLLPSFTPESALKIVPNEAGAEIELAEAEWNVWGLFFHEKFRRMIPDEDGPPPKNSVNRWKATISLETYRVVQCVWRKLLSEVAPAEPQFGLDGTTTRFYDGATCGSIWSPHGSSEMGFFVLLSKDLRQLTRVSPADRASAEEKLRDDALYLWHRIAGNDAKCE